MAISIQIPADIGQLNRRWTREFTQDYGAAAKRTGSVRFAFLETCEKHGVVLGNAFAEELANWREAEANGLNLQPPETLLSPFQVKLFLAEQGHVWDSVDDGVPF